MQTALVGLLVVLCVSQLGCQDRQAPTAKGGSSANSRTQESVQDALLVDNIAIALNDLPNRVDTELRRERKILDATTSADGQEVLATCSTNPFVPGSPEYNYLQVPLNNANFETAGVKPGDIVRYYIKYDQDSLDRGFEERSYITLTVRRLDDRNPENALLLQESLQSPVLNPERVEIWRFSGKRMNAIRSALDQYLKFRDPAVGWEPSGDRKELDELVENADRWLRGQQDRKSTWQPPELLDSLPEALRTSTELERRLAVKSLESARLVPGEGRLLQQAVWTRDIAAWAKGAAVTDPETARSLFDWTVRNIQLTPGDESSYIHHPWQALLYGHGTAEDRAWVFIELCRQQSLPAVILTVRPDPDLPAEFWLPAVLIDGELHLFDAMLGLPVPGPEVGETATLAEVVAKPELLDGLVPDSNGESESTYRVTPEILKSVEAYVVASPLQLSHAAELLENALEGEQYVALAANADQLAKSLDNNPHLQGVRLWPRPFQSVIDEQTIKPSKRRLAVIAFAPYAYHPFLWQARGLHFQGDKPAPAHERESRLSKPRNGHSDAIGLYTDPGVRPSEEALERMPPEVRSLELTTKNLAAYWLGMLSYDLGRYDTARFWLEDQVLGADPDPLLADAARYNLACTYEQLEDFEKAAKLLQSCGEGTTQHAGNLVRAAQLMQRADEERGSGVLGPRLPGKP